MFIKGVSYLADLHTHLMGCGDWKFWKTRANAADDTYLTDTDLYYLGLPDIFRGRPISVPEFAKRLGQSALRDLFIMRCPSSFADFEKRFFLRKRLVTAHPHILADLIEAEARKQAEGGVGYVEYSLGGELVEQRYRTSILEGARRAERLGVYVRFLAAFRRQDSRLVWHDQPMNPQTERGRDAIRELLSKLEERPEERLAWLEGARFSDGYIDYSAQLQRLAMLDSLFKNGDSDSERLSRLIVGLDLMGSEDGYPWIPFVEPTFQDWIKHQRNDRPHFGIRIHLSEGISPGDDYGHSHLRMGLDAAYVLVENVECPVRFGHGLGTIWMPEEAFLRVQARNVERVGRPLASEVGTSTAKEQFFREFRRFGWEMNISSNYLLQSYTGTTARNSKEYAFLHPVILAVCVAFPVTLGSDDPGIFGIDGLLGEYQLLLSALRLDPDNPDYAKMMRMSQREWLAYHMSFLACSGFSLAFASEEDRKQIPGFGQTQLIRHIRDTLVSPRSFFPGERIIRSLPRFLLDP